MIPHVTRGGRSFKGAFQYYLHDQGKSTRERIDWTHTINLSTDNPDKAWRRMAYFAMSQDRLKEASGQKTTGRKTTHPVFAYSLSWHPNENPDKDHMLEVAMASIKKLGLQEYQAVVIAHRDTPHKHCHIIVNRIHPETGLVASNSHTHRKLSAFAREYQLEQGMDYCPQREENHRKRENGQTAVYHDKLVQAAWDSSDNGKSFALALSEHGYILARGRKRLVVVEKTGKVLNPIRLLDGVKAKDFKAKTADIDQTTLPDADEISSEIEKKRAEEKRLRLESDKAKITPDFNKASEPPKVKLTEEFEKTSKPRQVEQEPPVVQEAEPEQQVQIDPAFIPEDVAEQIAHSLNRTQDRHIKECGDLSSHHRRLINAEKMSLSEYYQFEEQKAEIARMKKSVAKPKWWKKVLGLTKRDKIKLSEKVRTYQHSKYRYNERISTLENNFNRELDQLLTRQQKEWQKQQLLAKQMEASRYWERSNRLSNNMKSPGRHTGPELE